MMVEYMVAHFGVESYCDGLHLLVHQAFDTQAFVLKNNLLAM
jgi:hypothetical protein